MATVTEIIWMGLTGLSSRVGTLEIWTIMSELACAPEGRWGRRDSSGVDSGVGWSGRAACEKGWGKEREEGDRSEQ